MGRRRALDRTHSTSSTDAERAQARAAVLGALPGAAPRVLGELVGVLRSFSGIGEWLAWVGANTER